MRGKRKEKQKLEKAGAGGQMFDNLLERIEVLGMVSAFDKGWIISSF